MANKKAIPEAKQALNQMKLEIANEVGIPNYDTTDKGKERVLGNNILFSIIRC